jgi:hypothetical protein
MTSEYKIDDIKKILKKIEALSERKHIEKVKKIIFDENPNLSTTKKSSGILLFFHNLTQDTYKKLDLFFNKLETDKIIKITNKLSESYDKTLSDIDTPSLQTNQSNQKIKLSNAEKKLIKKKEYHNEITQKTDDVYISDDDAFFK